MAQYSALRFRVAPHGEAIIRPSVSEQPDYEGEIGIIIGKTGRHIPEDKALDYVAGYTIINEGSVRDWCARGHRIARERIFTGRAPLALGW